MRMGSDNAARVKACSPSFDARSRVRRRAALAIVVGLRISFRSSGAGDSPVPRYPALATSADQSHSIFLPCANDLGLESAGAIEPRSAGPRGRKEALDE